MFAEGEEMYLQGKSNKQKMKHLHLALLPAPACPHHRLAREKFSVAEGLVQYSMQWEKMSFNIDIAEILHM